MAEVERGWFRRRFAGLDLPKRYQTEADPDADFSGAAAGPAVVEEPQAAWREEIAFAERFTRDHGLGFAGRDSEGEPISLRELLVHMIERPGHDRFDASAHLRPCSGCRWSRPAAPAGRRSRGGLARRPVHGQADPRAVWTERIALAPSPTAAATRFIDPDRTSPTARTSGWPVSNSSGRRPSSARSPRATRRPGGCR